MLTGRGIIPAYAGSTPTAPSPKCRSGDHPRIRGEHQEGLVGALGAVGSSPHTRGALPERVPVPHLAGIIPAYAGST